MAPATQTLARFIGWAWARGGQAAVLAGMAEFAACSGNRRVEFKGLDWPQVGQSEIRLVRAKQRGGDEPIVEVIEVSSGLADLLDRMRVISGTNKTGPVFPAARGGSSKDSAFKSTWSRLVAQAMDCSAGPPVLTPDTRFHLHDLRAHFVTEHKRQRPTLPDMHKDPATTARVYDRSQLVHRKAP